MVKRPIEEETELSRKRNEEGGNLEPIKKRTMHDLITCNIQNTTLNKKAFVDTANLKSDTSRKICGRQEI